MSSAWVKRTNASAGLKPSHTMGPTPTPEELAAFKHQHKNIKQCEATFKQRLKDKGWGVRGWKMPTTWQTYCAAVQELLRIERGSNPLSAEVDVDMGDDTASLQLTNLEEGDQEGQEEQVETWVSTRDSITLMTPAEESPCILCSSTGECDC